MRSVFFKDSSAKRARNYDHASITEGSIWKALLSFFFPVLFGTFFQQLYNTIDAVVVGRAVGTEALAAVGGGAAIFVNLLVGFFVGLTSGAGVLIAQFYGAQNKRDISRSVHTALALCVVGGVLLSVIGVAASRAILIATKTPAETLSAALLYLRIYFVGMVPMFLYNMGASILRAIGDSKTPLLILIVGCLSNILLDVLFVIAFRMGVAGVAVATVLCQVESAVMTLWLLARSRDSYRLEWKKLSFTPHILAQIVRLGFPTGIQSCLYTVSNLIIQMDINSFGTEAVAAWAAYGKIDAIFWMLTSALGMSVTVFVGQNYGAHHYERIRKGMWESLGMAVLITIFFSIVFELWGKYIFLLFTGDGAVIAEGMAMMRFLIPFWGTYLSIEILSGTIRGVGESLTPMLITVFGVCLLRLLWLFVAVPRWPSITTVLGSYPITWTVTSIAFWLYYAGGTWLRRMPEDPATDGSAL